VGKLPLGHLRYLAGQMRYENPQRHEGRLRINSFFPPIPSAAFDRFLAAVIGRQRIPYSTYFAVTDQCPYYCGHCSYGEHQAGRLDTAGAMGVIRQIKGLGSPTIGLTGGEPLLRKDIAELVRAIGEDTASMVFTTGHSLSRERAEKLREAGLGCMMIGIEAEEEGEHDAVRGAAGSFAEAMRAIEYSLGAGLYTAISTVGTHEKIARGALGKMAELAERLGVQEFRVLEPIPTGRMQRQTAELPSAEETAAMAEFHKQWNQCNKGPVVSSFAYLESEEMFGCGAGYHHLYIDAVGNVCPCDLTPLAFGNVLTRPLGEIWAEMGKWFGLPRCGCLMKELSRKWPEGPEKLPLGKEVSARCAGNARGGRNCRGCISGFSRTKQKQVGQGSQGNQEDLRIDIGDGGGGRLAKGQACQQNGGEGGGQVEKFAGAEEVRQEGNKGGGDYQEAGGGEEPGFAAPAGDAIEGLDLFVAGQITDILEHFVAQGGNEEPEGVNRESMDTRPGGSLGKGGGQGIEGGHQGGDQKVFEEAESLGKDIVKDQP